MHLFPTLRNYKKENLGKDILAGLIIMAVSIPISMGYAQIAGLPAVYGLYGSVLPILFFAVFSTSPQFIFGVDAAPAALVGSALLSMGIESGSEEAMRAVPVLTLFVALWLFAFSYMKAGKLVNYISAPVMGGFITGICTTIILMQIPKLFGGSRCGRIFRACCAYRRKSGKTESAVPFAGAFCTFYIASFQKADPQIPDGGASDGSRSLYDKVSAA